MTQALDEINTKWTQEFPIGSPVHEKIVTFDEWFFAFQTKFFRDLYGSRTAAVNVPAPFLRDLAIEGAVESFTFDMALGEAEAGIELAKQTSWETFRDAHMKSETALPIVAVSALGYMTRQIELWNSNSTDTSKQWGELTDTAEKNAVTGLTLGTHEQAQAALSVAGTVNEMTDAARSVIRSYQDEVSTLLNELKDIALDVMAFTQRNNVLEIVNASRSAEPGLPGLS